MRRERPTLLRAAAGGNARVVTALPADDSVSGWLAMLGPLPEPRVLDRDLTADWVIVGAGFAGLSAARRLLQIRPGDRIVMLDAQRVGEGAAGRNSGFMIDLPHPLNTEAYAGARDHDRQWIAMNRAAIAFARDAAEEYGLAQYVDACGKYHGATDGHGIRALRTFEAHLDALGETYTPLDAEAMRHVTGSGYFIGGTHAPGAVIIQPAAYVRGFAAGLASRIDIHERSPVVRIEPGPTPVVHTPRGRVAANRVILTVNGHVESFGYFKRRLVHVFTYASMTRTLSKPESSALGGLPSWALIPADPMGSTIRRLREDRILVRNTFTYNPDRRTSAARIDRIGRRHDSSFRARFPMLGTVGMEYRWGGHLCLSLNDVPAFGEIERGIFAACCQNGLGTVRGTLGGMLIADLAADVPNPMLDTWLAFPPPARIYPEPVMTIGARSRLWWLQRRAGSDL